MLRPDEDNSLLLDWCVNLTIYIGIALPDSCEQIQPQPLIAKSK